LGPGSQKKKYSALANAKQKYSAVGYFETILQLQEIYMPPPWISHG